MFPSPNRKSLLLPSNDADPLLFACCCCPFPRWGSGMQAEVRARYLSWQFRFDERFRLGIRHSTAHNFPNFCAIKKTFWEGWGGRVGGAKLAFFICFGWNQGQMSFFVIEGFFSLPKGNTHTNTHMWNGQNLFLWASLNWKRRKKKP